MNLLKGFLPRLKAHRITGQTLTEYILLIAVVGMVIFKFKSETSTKYEKLNLASGGYSLKHSEVVNVNYASTKNYKVSNLDFDHKKRSVRITSDLENGRKKQDEIPLVTNQAKFLQQLKKSDLLEAKYSKTKADEYIYEGLYLNGQTLEHIYYQRVPANWTQQNNIID